MVVMWARALKMSYSFSSFIGTTLRKNYTYSVLFKSVVSRIRTEYESLKSLQNGLVDFNYLLL